MERKVDIIGLLLAVVLFLGCNIASSNNEASKMRGLQDLQLPIFHKAKNINEGFSKKHLIKYVEYDVEMYYPAEDIIRFYDNKMAKMDFQPFGMIEPTRITCDWHTYVDGTKEGDPNVTSCNISWVNNENNKKRATLVLNYYWPNKEKRRVLNSNKDLKVEFRVQPFYLDPPQN